MSKMEFGDRDPQEILDQIQKSGATEKEPLQPNEITPLKQRTEEELRAVYQYKI